MKRQVHMCTCIKKFKIQRVGESKYRVSENGYSNRNLKLGFLHKSVSVCCMEASLQFNAYELVFAWLSAECYKLINKINKINEIKQ